MLPSTSLSSLVIIVGYLFGLVHSNYYYNTGYYPERSSPQKPQHSPILSNSQLQPYLAKPFQRLCLSGRYKGFSVGRSDDGKYCYYVCPDDARFLPTGTINYLCCSANFVLDYQTRICARINNYHHHSRYPQQQQQQQQQWNVQDSRREKGHRTKQCLDGMVKPHPYDCQSFYRCLFNFQFIEMKCPFNFHWNPHWKMCDPTYRCHYYNRHNQDNNHLATTENYFPMQQQFQTKLDPVTPYTVRRRFHGSSNPVYSSTLKPRPVTRIYYEDDWSKKFYNKNYSQSSSINDNSNDWNDYNFQRNQFKFNKIYDRNNIPSRKPSDMFKRRGGQNNNANQWDKKSKFGRKSIDSAGKTTRRKFWQKPWTTTSTTTTTTTTTTSTSPSNSLSDPEMTEQIEINNQDSRFIPPMTTSSTEKPTNSTVDLMTTSIPISTTTSFYTEQKKLPNDAITTPNDIKTLTSTMTTPTIVAAPMTTQIIDDKIETTTIQQTTDGPELPTQSPLRDITTTTIREPLVFEENSQCYEPTARYKDNEDCQCFYECEFNKRLTRNCCPDGLFFNQLDYEPSSNGTDSLEESESADLISYCDLIENVDCKTIIQ